MTAPRLSADARREQILDVAIEVFGRAGFHGASLNDIAAAAGMSTGAVFANFTDKSDLFREIMTDDMEALAVAMRDAAERARTVEDGLLKVFMAGYTFYKTRLQLARAAFSVSWDADGGPTLRGLSSSQAFQELFVEQLTAGVERGELSQESEIKLRSQMLFDAYLANFPQAIFEGWSLDALQARARDQIRILLAGARRG